MKSLRKDYLNFRTIFVPLESSIRNEILEQAHKSKYTFHPGAIKLYQDLRKDFWWPGMKRDINEFVSKCLTCQRIKIEHKKLVSLLQPLDIPIWKWDSVFMDFILGLPRTFFGYDNI